jgi:hypothetical protein
MLFYLNQPTNQREGEQTRSVLPSPPQGCNRHTLQVQLTLCLDSSLLPAGGGVREKAVKVEDETQVNVPIPVSLLFTVISNRPLHLSSLSQLVSELFNSSYQAVMEY